MGAKAAKQSLLPLAIIVLACGFTSSTLWTEPAPTPPSPSLAARTPTSFPEGIPPPRISTATLIVQVTNDDGSPRPVLRNVMWSEYGDKVFYNLSTRSGESRFAFEMGNGNTVALSPIAPQEEQDRFQSPRGLYAIQAELTFQTPTPDPSQLSYEITLIDLSTQTAFPLISNAPGYPFVQWGENDDRFVVTFPDQVESPVYVGDTHSKAVHLLSEIAEHEDFASYDAALSPDGSQIAVASSDLAQLQIIDLEDGRSVYATGSNAAFFTWTPDSRLVYYKTLSPNPGVEFDGYYLFDTIDLSSELLITQELLRAAGLCPQSCYLIPSPAGNQLLLGWGDYTHDYLWVIDIP